LIDVLKVALENTKDELLELSVVELLDYIGKLLEELNVVVLD
jgi:hypothetical protein